MSDERVRALLDVPNEVARALEADRRHDDLRERFGLENMPMSLGIGRVVRTDPRPSGLGTETVLPINTYAWTEQVDRHVLDDEPRLQATLVDLEFVLLEYVAAQGCRFVTPTTVQASDCTPWPTPIDEPWWGEALIRLGLRQRRYTKPRPLYALRAEVRAA